VTKVYIVTEGDMHGCERRIVGVYANEWVALAAKRACDPFSYSDVVEHEVEGVA
jgi:hypothetical protein